MDSEDVNKDVVHPEVRAHINSLVSAVSPATPNASNMETKLTLTSSEATV
jgi:hypothetical protein